MPQFKQHKQITFLEVTKNFFNYEIVMCSLKIFAPIAVLSLAVLVPINWSGGRLDPKRDKNLEFSEIDKLSISNVPPGSKWYGSLLYFFLIYL